jgi:hypothetical protein
MSISKYLLREKTLPRTRGTQTFYASTTYVPVYGKTNFKIGGKGSPGNAPTGGNYAGTNPPTGGNVSYNPPTGGNYAGSNPTYYRWNEYLVAYSTANYAPGSPAPQPAPYTSYQAMDVSNAYYWYTVANFSFNSNFLSDYVTLYAVNGYGTSTPSPHNTYTSDANTTYYSIDNYSQTGTTPGNAYYNPTTPGNAYYNPTTPGNAYYNPVTPGNSGPTYTVLGVTFPGGPAGSVAPYVNPTPVSLSYTPAGVSISVYSGGYIEITNN